jgi:phosphoribosyl 1,2-cyclic phosphate phosphodiesterase
MQTYPPEVIAPPQALGDFRAAYPFLTDVFEITPWEFGQEYRFDQVILTPLPANHRIQTAGFLIEAEKKLAYFTDTAGLPGSTAVRVKEVDMLICDATFNADNWYPDSHMSIDEAIALGVRIKARNTVLTHLAMHYSIPVTVAELEEKLRAYKNVSLAFDGMKITIG